jgi:apolipoprotein N-acyltransferase
VLGVITSFSLPPYNFIFLNFFTFPLILLLLIEVKKKSLLWLNFKIGWIFGTGYFFSSIYCIVFSLTFEDIFKNFIKFALILIPSFLGLFYGLITLILSKFNLKKNFSSILIFALVFSIIEYLRGYILGGFPWNLIAYSWTYYLNSLQVLSTIGTYSFNLLSITIFLLPLLIVFKKSLFFKVMSILILSIILFSINYYGLSKIKNNEKFYKNFENFSIKIISPKISIDKFFDNNSIDFILDELVSLSNPQSSKPTIFIFPEGVLAGYSLNQLNMFKENFFKAFSDEHIIIMGINTEKIINNNLEVYNSMVILDNKLNLLNQYNKNKLVPFGEFLPFEKVLKRFGLKKVTQGYQSFSPGKTRNIILVNKKKFSFIPLICYEIIYSGNISKNLDHTNFIINISEDGWFGKSAGPSQHFSHSIFRSIEEGKNIIRSSNNGISAFIDSNGIVLHKLESTEKGVIEVKDYKDLKKTNFSKHGNKIFFYFILIYIILFFFIYKIEIRKEKI